MCNTGFILFQVDEVKLNFLIKEVNDLKENDSIILRIKIDKKLDLLIKKIANKEEKTIQSLVENLLKDYAYENMYLLIEEVK